MTRLSPYPLLNMEPTVVVRVQVVITSFECVGYCSHNILLVPRGNPLHGRASRVIALGLEKIDHRDGDCTRLALDGTPVRPG